MASTQIKNISSVIGLVGGLDWKSMLRELRLTGGIGAETASSTLALLLRDAKGGRVLTSATSA